MGFVELGRRTLAHSSIAERRAVVGRCGRGQRAALGVLHARHRPFPRARRVGVGDVLPVVVRGIVDSEAAVEFVAVGDGGRDGCERAGNEPSALGTLG